MVQKKCAILLNESHDISPDIIYNSGLLLWFLGIFVALMFASIIETTCFLHDSFDTKSECVKKQIDFDSHNTICDCTGVAYVDSIL